METVLWILGIHWVLGIVFSLGLVWYGSHTGNDILWLVGGEFFKITLVTGFLSSSLIIFWFLKGTLSMRKANKEFMNKLLNIPHREEIDEAWLDIFDEEYYKSLRYNVKEGGWVSGMLVNFNVDCNELEKEEVIEGKNRYYYFRPKTLSHLNKLTLK